MSDTSAIEWTDATWTPIRARVKADAGDIARAKGYTSLAEIAVRMAGRVGPHCEHASPGCLNCYSETNNGRCLPHNGTGLPFDRRARDLVDMFVDQRILEQPLHWTRPRKIFVCSQTDLFGEFVPDGLIDHVFTVMRRCEVMGKGHVFQVLTKRADRARTFINAIPTPRNMWLGVSVEDQARAEERIPELLQTQAAVRFISAEPLLGPLNLRLNFRADHADMTSDMVHQRLHWVIAGGESGPRARPSHPDWFRNLRDQCQVAGVPFFFKQWGEWSPEGYPGQPTDKSRMWRCWVEGSWRSSDELPTTQMRVASNSLEDWMAHVGKRAAGRQLDGREWNDYPTVAT